MSSVVWVDVSATVSSRAHLVLRPLIALAVVPLVPLGWYWAGHPARTCGPADERTLNWIGAVMIGAAMMSFICALVGRRCTVVGGAVAVAGWASFIVGLFVAVSCLQ
jgi:hypothetical protein